MDGYLDGSTDGFAGRLEVIEGRTGRRVRRPEERMRIAAESLAPGAKVADVAHRYGVTRWQVYDWRRKLRAGELAVPQEVMSEPAFAALVLEPAFPEDPHSQRPNRAAAADGIDLLVAGVTVRVGPDVGEAQLVRVIRAVRAAST
jgi:transposase